MGGADRFRSRGGLDAFVFEDADENVVGGGGACGARRHEGGEAQGGRGGSGADESGEMAESGHLGFLSVVGPLRVGKDSDAALDEFLPDSWRR